MAEGEAMAVQESESMAVEEGQINGCRIVTACEATVNRLNTSPYNTFLAVSLLFQLCV